MRELIKWLALLPAILLVGIAYGQGQQFTGLIVQTNPVASTLVTLYTVPANTSVTLNTIWITNRDTAQHTFRMSVARQGAADTLAQYIYYNIPIPPTSAFIQSIDLVLNQSDQIRFFGDAQQFSVNLWGNILGTIPTPTPTPTPT